MRPVPAGRHPAAALAAVIYNWEIGRELYDVDHAANTGTLRVNAPALQRQSFITITHGAHPKNFRVRSVRGTVYLTPWVGQEIIVTLLADVERIYAALPPVTPTVGIADVAHHESLWQKLKMPRGLNILSPRTSGVSKKMQVVGHLGLDWTFAPLSNYFGKMSRQRLIGQAHLYHNLFGFVMDLSGSYLPDAKPEGLTKTIASNCDDSYWLPSSQNFQSPTVVKLEMLVLLDLGEDTYIILKYHSRNCPWSQMELFKPLPPLEVVCPRVEADHHKKSLQSQSVCGLCDCPLVGRCEAVITRGSAVALCPICGAAIRVAQRDHSDFEWSGSMVEWEVFGEWPTYQLDPNGEIWTVKRALSKDAPNLLGVVRISSKSEIDSAQIRSLGLGDLYKATDMVVFAAK